jgi:hypothetical protein
MDAATKAGLTPSEMAVSRPICPACQAAIENGGGKGSSSVRTVWWPR